MAQLWGPPGKRSGGPLAAATWGPLGRGRSAVCRARPPLRHPRTDPPPSEGCLWEVDGSGLLGPPGTAPKDRSGSRSPGRTRLSSARSCLPRSGSSWAPVPQAAFQKAQPRRPLAPRPLPCPTGAISRHIPSGGRVARTPEEAAELGQPRACGGRSVRVRCVCTVAQSLGAVSSAWLTTQNRPLSHGARAWGSRAVRGGSGSACRGMCNSLYPLDASNNPSCDNLE